MAAVTAACGTCDEAIAFLGCFMPPAVHADMCLHPETPLVALPGPMHLRIARLGGVLRRAMSPGLTRGSARG